MDVAPVGIRGGVQCYLLPPPPPLPPPPELGASRLFCASLGRSVPGVVDVPGVTGSELFGAGPMAREPDPDGGDFDGGAVVVWANAAPEISATTPVAMMKCLSIDYSISRDLVHGGQPSSQLRSSQWRHAAFELFFWAPSGTKRAPGDTQALTVEMECMEVYHACVCNVTGDKFVPLSSVAARGRD